MSESPTVPPSAGKLLVELAGQKAPPDFWEELKKRAKKWLKKWAIRVSVVGMLAGSNILSYQYGKGADISWLWNMVTFAAIVVLVWTVLNKVK